MAKKTKRKIVVDHIEYEWVYGNHIVVIRRNGKVVAKPTLTEITGLSWNDIERGQWKGWLSITPKNVATWIQKNL